MRRSNCGSTHFPKLIFVAVLGLGGCSLAPIYKPPTITLAKDAWQEDNIWHEVKTNDDNTAELIAKRRWWKSYGDVQLDGLMQKLNSDNPGLASALYRYNQATAYVSQLRSLQGPNVDSGGVLLENRQSENRPLRGAGQPDVFDANTVGVTASYTLDFWGKVKNLVAAGEANATANAADLATVRLFLQVQLADTYARLRGADVTIKLLNEAVSAYTRALDLTQNRYAGGVASGLDVSRAETQLSLVKTQVAAVLAQRATYEHQIASLVGEPAMSFHLAVEQTNLKLPEIPLDLPSSLLLRRPDIVAAERRTAAANASVGVARAAYYPDFSLTASYGFQNTGQPDLLGVANSFWSIGPQLFFNLFDSGLRDAKVAYSLSVLDGAGADYRATVLNAFQQVEDDLSRLKYSAESLVNQSAAQVSSERTLELALNRYREGAVNYLEVVTAQASALSAQRDLVDLRTQQLRLSMDLIRAIGGGWSQKEDDIK